MLPSWIRRSITRSIVAKGEARNARVEHGFRHPRRMLVNAAIAFDELFTRHDNSARDRPYPVSGHSLIAAEIPGIDECALFVTHHCQVADRHRLEHHGLLMNTVSLGLDLLIRIQDNARRCRRKRNV